MDQQAERGGRICAADATGASAKPCRVRQRVPYKQRLAVDRAIVERDTDNKGLETIRSEFGLAEYGVGAGAFRAYAKRIAAEARDYFLASMLGSVFGQMDGGRRVMLHDAAQNMVAGLLLKIARSAAQDAGVDELAKLARINLDLRKAAAVSLGGAFEDAADGQAGGDGLAAQVRQLYGVELGVASSDETSGAPADRRDS